MLALEIDLELSFFDFEPFLKTKLRFLADFPIQIAENVCIGDNFVASYLRNRAKLKANEPILERK